MVVELLLIVILLAQVDEGPLIWELVDEEPPLLAQVDERPLLWELFDEGTPLLA